MNGIPLEKFERWMQSVIEHPGSDDEAWRSGDAVDSIAYEEALANVRRTEHLSEQERLGIYRRMFRLRMTDAMRSDFPGVLHAVGDEEFDRMILEEYIRRFPSDSFTLEDLGRHFERFLAESDRPEKEFLSELARLEWALTRISDCENLPSIDAAAVSAIPPERWNDARFVPVTAFLLLGNRWAVGEYLDAVGEGKEATTHQQGSEYLVLCRQEFTVWQRSVSEEEFRTLSALAAGEKLGSVVSRMEGNEQENAGRIFGWFRSWFENGYFHTITI